MLAVSPSSSLGWPLDTFGGAGMTPVANPYKVDRISTDADAPWQWPTRGFNE